LRDDPETTTTTTGSTVATACPVCAGVFAPTGRQVYCSTRCRKKAFRRRRGLAAVPVVPVGVRRGELTVYECGGCGARRLGVQRCEDCGTFAHSAGLGGACPCCDEPVTLADLGLDLADTR
jgi:hypothetical protein